MRKVLTLALALMLCLGILALVAYADGEEGQMSLSPSSITASPGDEFTVVLALDSDPGVAVLDLVITYDDSRLEVVSYTACDDLTGGTWTIVNNANWLTDTQGDTYYKGDILYLTYRVLDGAPSGDAYIDVTMRAAANWDLVRVPFNDVSTIVTIGQSAGDAGSISPSATDTSVATTAPADPVSDAGVSTDTSRPESVDTSNGVGTVTGNGGTGAASSADGDDEDSDTTGAPDAEDADESESEEAGTDDAADDNVVSAEDTAIDEVGPDSDEDEFSRDEAADEVQDASQNGGRYVWIIIVAVVVCAAIVIAVVLVVKKKKHKANYSS